jgi:methylenetetrahydrofolate dehydrogenase (NADP+)/methenyltetrahydrofolate cyclohydrolase
MTRPQTAQRIDGKQQADALLDTLRGDVARFVDRTGQRPGLAVVLVGDDAASEVYVRNKTRQTEAVGMRSWQHHLPAETDELALLHRIAELNADPQVHGILVQLPLPPHLNAETVLEAIDPSKDVDGFHPLNVGRLHSGQTALVPCTPAGCMHLLRQTLTDLKGLHAVVIGRSHIVGKPMAQLLLAANCTVTIAHSHSRDLPDLCAAADIVVAAVGRPHFVRGEWLKPGCCVIDVGINRIATPEGGTRLVGDVDFEAASAVAGAITPVPGGVGPMTIACLLCNTLQAAKVALSVG